jgi:hypothetical protein
LITLRINSKTSCLHGVTYCYPKGKIPEIEDAKFQVQKEQERLEVLAQAYDKETCDARST